MTTCGRCGHTVEVGRFCTNCGAPVDASADAGRTDGRTDTAERPAAGGPGRSAVPSSPPPPLPPPPSSARYPLFADEVGGGGPVAPPPPPPPPPPSAAPTPPPSSHRSSGRRGSGWLVALAVLALLVVVGLGGGVLLLSSGDDKDGAGDSRRTSAPSQTPDSESPGSPEASASAPASDPPAGGISDVARTATVEVPATAKPGTDVDGSRIRYDAAQMLDGDPTTCWRMVGDGTGEEIVLTLAEPTTLSEVGIINGYAKSARDGRGRTIDWYVGNRRVREVEWVFDDGTSVTQDLGRTRDLQSLPIEPVETSTVTLRLVDVSRPGKNRRSARDNTAISEIALLGTPAG